MFKIFLSNLNISNSIFLTKLNKKLSNVRFSTNNWNFLKNNIFSIGFRISIYISNNNPASNPMKLINDFQIDLEEIKMINLYD